MASKMAAEKVHFRVLILDVQDPLLKQYREIVIYKGSYIPTRLSKYADYESICCGKHIRVTALLFKMASKMATETSKITIDSMFETD